MKLTVTMDASPQSISSAIIYIKIIPSPIIIKLIQVGPIIITQGQQQIITLDPGQIFDQS